MATKRIRVFYSSFQNRPRVASQATDQEEKEAFYACVIAPIISQTNRETKIEDRIDEILLQKNIGNMWTFVHDRLCKYFKNDDTDGIDLAASVYFAVKSNELEQYLLECDACELHVKVAN